MSRWDEWSLGLGSWSFVRPKSLVRGPPRRAVGTKDEGLRTDKDHGRIRAQAPSTQDYLFIRRAEADRVSVGVGDG